MYTVVRSYFGAGAKELFDVLEKNKADVEKTLRSVKGLVSYTLVRSADGGFSVTVCNDKAGTDESLEKARDWIARNAAGTGVAAPKVSEGSVVFDLKAWGPALVPCAGLRPSKRSPPVRRQLPRCARSGHSPRMAATPQPLILKRFPQTKARATAHHSVIHVTDEEVSLCL
jgi:hypothetical protein